MKPILPNYKDSGVLIIGDVMLDRSGTDQQDAFHQKRQCQ